MDTALFGRRLGPVAVAIFTVLACLVLGGCDPDAAEKKAVRETLQVVEDAIEANDARTYTELVTQGTFLHYERILRLANTARQAEVAVLPPAERFLILLLRHHIPLEERQNLDGRTLLSRIVSEGWWAGSAGDGSSIDYGEIKINGAYARVQIVWNGKPTGFWVQFIRENAYGQPDPTAPWKLDDPSMDAFSNDLIPRLAREINRNENDLMVMVVARESGEPVRPDIWDRP